ncbi:MAG: tryptophan-rich sensory protein [Blautia sp.]|nr:tryptophan-rich sensory protein [Blautia sp.]
MRIEKDKLAISILIPLAVGAVSGFLNGNAIRNFDMFPQSPLTPPDWVFPVVWTILYLLMGIASYLVYQQGSEHADVRQALRLYILQLIFNYLWPVFFFQLEWFLFSFFWLLALWGMVLLLIRKFGTIRTIAGRLLIPYLVWLTFAAYLNWEVYRLN